MQAQTLSLVGSVGMRLKETLSSPYEIPYIILTVGAIVFETLFDNGWVNVTSFAVTLLGVIFWFIVLLGSNIRLGYFQRTPLSDRLAIHIMLLGHLTAFMIVFQLIRG